VMNHRRRLSDEIPDLQGLLHGLAYRIGLHRLVERPLHEIAAVGVQDVHQIEPAAAKAHEHEIDVPYLVRSLRRLWLFERERTDGDSWTKQALLLENRIGVMGANARKMLVLEQIRQALVSS